MNKTILIGRTTKDIELKTTQSNLSFARFTLAVNRQYSKDGESETDFISCLAWRKTAELLYQYVKKGDRIAVEGRIQTGSYESDKGTIYTTEIVCDNIQFLESKNTNDNVEEKVQDDMPF